jgi:hypothetical protein
VSKDALTQAVCPDTFATADSLTQCIADVRRALHDGSWPCSCIEVTKRRRSTAEIFRKRPMMSATGNSAAASNPW